MVHSCCRCVPRESPTCRSSGSYSPFLDGSWIANESLGQGLPGLERAVQANRTVFQHANACLTPEQVRAAPTTWRNAVLP